ncbi:MAG: hemolysin III family protein [Clostridia bacterium]|nr:hemolysin III family protein [Clostridia bacterium]
MPENELDLTRNNEAKKDYSVQQRKYTAKEEFWNVLTHAVGAIVCLVFSVLMIIKTCHGIADGKYGGVALVSIIAFSVSLVVMYTMSSIYHACKYGSLAKTVLRRFDYCSISLLIAGSYMPYSLIGLVEFGTEQPADTVWGMVISLTVVTLAIVTIALNAISVQKFRIFTFISYVVMGWMIILRIYHLYLAIGITALVLLFSGGVAYTVGIAVYKLRKIPYYHAIWHMFVVAGSVLMICGMYFCIL